MQLETETLCGAAPGERSLDRVNQRNGYRDRDLSGVEPICLAAQQSGAHDQRTPV